MPTAVSTLERMHTPHLAVSNSNLTTASRQCFCGVTPNFANANKLDDSKCSQKCATDPSESCGATYIMSLYKINNPEGNAADGKSTARVPACLTSPLCGQQVCNTSLSIADRVASLVNSFTQEEKILNLVGKRTSTSHEWRRLLRVDHSD